MKFLEEALLFVCHVEDACSAKDGAEIASRAGIGWPATENTIRLRLVACHGLEYSEKKNSFSEQIEDRNLKSHSQISAERQNCCNSKSWPRTLAKNVA